MYEGLNYSGALSMIFSLDFQFVSIFNKKKVEDYGIFNMSSKVSSGQNINRLPITATDVQSITVEYLRKGELLIIVSCSQIVNIFSHLGWCLSLSLSPHTHTHNTLRLNHKAQTRRNTVAYTYTLMRSDLCVWLWRRSEYSYFDRV